MDFPKKLKQNKKEMHFTYVELFLIFKYCAINTFGHNMDMFGEQDGHHQLQWKAGFKIIAETGHTNTLVHVPCGGMHEHSLSMTDLDEALDALRADSARLEST